ncbi:MAG: hypothetical protein QXR87_05720 [Candidatus Hadarchaeales archaeon]
MEGFEGLTGKLVKISWKDGQELKVKKGVVEGASDGFLRLRTRSNLYLIQIHSICTVKVIGQGLEWRGG